jgi:hypothetical protein
VRWDVLSYPAGTKDAAPAADSHSPAFIQGMTLQPLRYHAFALVGHPMRYNFWGIHKTLCITSAKP